MITFTKEQLVASAHARIEFAEMMLAGELEPLKERTWSIELELARIALASLEAEAAAWDYELASCITCEGPQGFKRVIEHEYPPEWAIEEGRARNIVPLYADPPAPVSVPGLLALDRLAGEMLNHAMNCERRVAVAYTHCAHRLAEEVGDLRAAMLQGAYGNSPTIPDGWKLVPVELTGAMTNAMTDAILDDLHNVDVWRSVLAAAPQQETK